MSVFVLKLIAVASMLTDHIGYFLFPRFVGYPVYAVLRSIGRVAFPVYCFLIVNGYEKTHDAKRYLTRLIAFAVISQIPFVLTFDANPFPEDLGLRAELAYRAFLCAALIAAVGAAWLTTVRPGASVLWPVLALGLAVCRVEFRGVRILSDELNVFYTLSLGLAVIGFLDGLRREDRDMLRSMMQALAIFSAFFLVRENADYGAMGVVLITAIWLTRENRYLQAGVMAAWCAMKYYDAPSKSYLLCSLAAVLLVLLYNGKLGRPIKRAFYLVYPLHLAVLGALTVYFMQTL